MTKLQTIRILGLVTCLLSTGLVAPLSSCIPGEVRQDGWVHFCASYEGDETRFPESTDEYGFYIQIEDLTLAERIPVDEEVPLPSRLASCFDQTTVQAQYLDIEGRVVWLGATANLQGVDLTTPATLSNLEGATLSANVLRSTVAFTSVSAIRDGKPMLVLEQERSPPLGDLVVESVSRGPLQIGVLTDCFTSTEMDLAFSVDGETAVVENFGSTQFRFNDRDVTAYNLFTEERTGDGCLDLAYGQLRTWFLTQ